MTVRQSYHQFKSDNSSWKQRLKDSAPVSLVNVLAKLQALDMSNACFVEPAAKETYPRVIINIQVNQSRRKPAKLVYLRSKKRWKICKDL